MPRQPRNLPEGSVQHLIARIVDGEFLLDTPGLRAHVLERLTDKLYGHDCRVFAYCLMSNHIHLAALVGKMRLDRLLQGLLGSVATRVNLRRDRVGHAFANRFKNRALPRERAGYLVSYIHNNEQRAGLAESPLGSRWSSHRAYMRLAPRPDWLDVGLGLELCGFEDTVQGRTGFNELVTSRSTDPRQPELSEDTGDDLHAGPWAGPPPPVVHAACKRFGVSTAAIRAGSRVAPIPRARAAILLAWCDGLGRRAAEMLPFLGITAAAASRAMARGREDGVTLAAAEAITLAVRGC